MFRTSAGVQKKKGFRWMRGGGNVVGSVSFGLRHFALYQGSISSSK